MVNIINKIPHEFRVLQEYEEDSTAFGQFWSTDSKLHWQFLLDTKVGSQNSAIVEAIA